MRTEPMERVNSGMLTVMSTKVTGRMIKQTVMVSISMQMAPAISVNGKMISRTVMDSRRGQMAADTKVST